MAPHATAFSALGVLGVFGALDEITMDDMSLLLGAVFLTPTMKMMFLLRSAHGCTIMMYPWSVEGAG
jgi:hypothetical protein